ncbi:MAG: shikimate kinase [Endomicrobium sp.]|jgi:shikimate kinase|nr:shikimate kinase [Endomicrobium sp.]
MNIVLTGFMGSGKTVVGNALARKLNRRFLDTDAMIEAQSEISIKEFFEKFSEYRFRLLEREIVKRAARYKDVVISCGGGVVLTMDNIKFLRRKGIIVNLYASPKEIYGRIKGGSSRPLLNCPNPVSKIRELLKKRKELYADCDYSFETDGLSADEAAEKILDKISDKI